MQPPIYTFLLLSFLSSVSTIKFMTASWVHHVRGQFTARQQTSVLSVTGF